MRQTVTAAEQPSQIFLIGLKGGQICSPRLSTAGEEFELAVCPLLRRVEL